MAAPVGDEVTTVVRYGAPALCMSDLLSVHLCVSHLRSSDTCASDAQLLGIRNPVTHPPCCSCGSAHALSSRVEPRAAPSQ